MNLFGKSWFTTLGGILTGAPILICQIFHICSVGHIGTTDWFSIISGLGAIFMGASAKDTNVSNAPSPGPAAVVPPQISAR